MALSLTIKVTDTPIQFSNQFRININTVKETIQLVLRNSNITELQTIYDEIEGEGSIGELTLTNSGSDTDVIFTNLPVQQQNCVLTTVQENEESINVLIINASTS